LNKDNSGKNLANNDKFIIFKYSKSWQLLRLKYDFWKAKYLFDKYRYYIDHENGTLNSKLLDYVDEKVYEKVNKMDEFFYKNKRTKIVVNAPAKRVVKLYEDLPRTINFKKISDLEKEWINEQLNLKLKNILNDTEDWASDLTKLKHVAVLDLICDKTDNSTCAAGIMVFEIDHFKTNDKITLVEASILRTKLTQPYISGLLAFRESFAYQELLKKTTIKPQLLIFDANGILHKREFGLASHIGVLENCATIGLAKKLHFVDNFPYKTLPEFKQYFQPLLNKFQDFCELKTVDNKVLGYAYLSGIDATDPVFISQGNKISLSTSINVMKMIDGYLNEMKKCGRESLVGFVDKMTRINLNKINGFDDKFDSYF
jgi:endonuclease V